MFNVRAVIISLPVFCCTGNKLCSRPGHPLVNHGQKVTLFIFIVAGAFIAGLVIYIEKARCRHQQKEKQKQKGGRKDDKGHREK